MLCWRLFSDVCIGKDLGHCRRINVVAGRAARAARLPLSWLDVAEVMFLQLIAAIREVWCLLVCCGFPMVIRQTDRQPASQAGRQAGMEGGSQAGRQTDTDRQTDGQAATQMEGEGGREGERERESARHVAPDRWHDARCRIPWKTMNPNNTKRSATGCHWLDTLLAIL